MYSEPVKPAGEIALVRGAGASADTARYDGVRLSAGTRKVLPGKHTPEITYSEPNRGYSLLSTMLPTWKSRSRPYAHRRCKARNKTLTGRCVANRKLRLRCAQSIKYSDAIPADSAT